MNDLRTVNKFEYIAPDSLNETLDLLAGMSPDDKILAGGTDLILQLKQRLWRPSVIVDIKRIPELNRLEWNREGGLHIGAAVPLSVILSMENLPAEYGLLLQACSLIGSVQVKNRGTIGGNICNAAPSADSVPALLCLGARVLLTSSKGIRTVALEDIFIEPGKTAINHDELVVEIEVPPPPAGSAGCYLRLATREEMDIAVASVASFITTSPEKDTFTDVRIALGAVAPTPLRARKAEAMLKGEKISSELIDKAAETAAGEASPISDLRGSADYRRDLVKVLTVRTLKKSCEQIGINL
jgi:carbon-monoxide dehydrogenase medium subunit